MLLVLFLVFMGMLPLWAIYFVIMLVMMLTCNPADVQEYAERRKDFKIALVGLAINLSILFLIFVCEGKGLAEM